MKKFSLLALSALLIFNFSFAQLQSSEDEEDLLFIQLYNLRVLKVEEENDTDLNSQLTITSKVYRFSKCIVFEDEEDTKGKICPPDIRKKIISKELKITISDETKILGKDRKPSTFEDLKNAYRINVYGYLDLEDNSLEALVVRVIAKKIKPSPSLPNTSDTSDGYFEVMDVDTGFAIDNVKIIAKSFPKITLEECKKIADCKKHLYNPNPREPSQEPVSPTEGMTFTKEEFKKYFKEGPEGLYFYTIEAEGYKRMNLHRVKLDKSEKFSDTIMMSPLSRSNNGRYRNDIPELREEYIRSLLKQGTVLVVGFVHDSYSGEPIAGVKVRIPKFNLVTTTNERGFYFFNIPEYSYSNSGKNKNNVIENKNNVIDYMCKEIMNTAITYIFSKDGYKTIERREAYPLNSNNYNDELGPYSKLNIEMVKGKGKIFNDIVLPGACFPKPSN
ncbi:MAG: hypothetical protein KatS3mg097_523 [Candidatus Parcubacteria bacterium]|nr:MAG: hypothetical protein KatS3mg097_523 [Candidatus Parcubacteria bacterium]